MQSLADILGVKVDRPASIETTALGAACFAGLQAGVYRSLDDIAACWRLEREFIPQLSQDERERFHARWLDAIRRVCSSH